MGRLIEPGQQDWAARMAGLRIKGRHADNTPSSPAPQ